MTDSCCASSAVVCMLAMLFHGIAPAADALPEVESLIQSSCIGCHDADTETRLNLSSLGHDLSNNSTYRVWVRIFDRVRRGEMPPPDSEQPNDSDRRGALSVLKKELNSASRRSQQTIGRVPSRRLTRREYENTLHDLLGIGGDLAKQLPPENKSAGSFDVIAARQEMSSVHARSLLRAADLALDETIQLGPAPNRMRRELDYFNSRYMDMWVTRPIRMGGGTVFRTDHDVVTFRGENYSFRSDHNGLRLPVAGRYRITVKAAAYQPRSAVTLSLKRQNDTQGESELFAAWDLGTDYRVVSTTKYLRPDDYFYVSADELEPAPDGKLIYNSQPASEFGGEGVRIRRVTVEGPLETSWPPGRTRKLFPGIKWNRIEGRRQGRVYEPVLTDTPVEHTRDIIAAFAIRALGRELSTKEIETLVTLAKTGLDAGRDFVDSVKVPLRVILVSPEVVFQAGEPGALDDSSLARRLSGFLWRSCPDDELMQLAKGGQLCEPETLRAQVKRMLGDPKV
ncbi:MAG: DUF1587 domain-containing protein, partial [Planctomycetaceae bacterium]